MSRKPAPEQTRARLLQAAAQIILAHGFSRLTLEAVAQEAGVSKGGLLYHFPSKEDLISGLINQLTVDFERLVEGELASEPTVAPGRWLRAYIRATFAHNPLAADTGAALAHLLATEPALLAQVRASFARIQHAIEHDGLDPVRATLLRLAADGFYFSAMLAFGPPEEPLRGQLFEELLRMSREDQGLERQ